MRVILHEEAGPQQINFSECRALSMATYRCGKCWKTFDDSQLKVLPGIRCPYCGHRIIYMVRKPIVKAVKAI
jgi:DNA-directed RNA polymerase subunit P